MKKIISLTVAAAMLAASGAALAAENEPAVYVNTAEIIFDDQPAVIVDGRTLVPARGVFEAMGAKVEWDGEKREVEVTSGDNKTIVDITIDDAEMKVYDVSGFMSTLLSGEEFHAPEKDVTLDVPAQIMNDRTMVPLRAISEALNADVQWDGKAYRVDITTADAPTDKSTYPGFSLTADATEVNEGENVDLYINVSNLPADTYASGVSATIKYDKENFEFVEATLVNGDEPIASNASADNPDFANDYLKMFYVTIDAETAAKADGKVMKVTFKSINGKEGSFELSNGYQTKIGYNTSLYADALDENEAAKATLFEGDDFNVDMTPVVINAGK